MEDILKRIKSIIDKEGISPSALADSIGIGRPLLSHVLSGRNNPSLQLVLKILEHYPAYSADWLLNGKKDLPPPSPQIRLVDQNPSSDFTVNKPEESSKEEVKKPKVKPPEGLPEVVLMMFEDKTYEAYKLRK